MFVVYAACVPYTLKAHIGYGVEVCEVSGSLWRSSSFISAVFNRLKLKSKSKSEWPLLLCSVSSLPINVESSRGVVILVWFV